ncbi:hypothetical protein [Salmonella enterica]|nr:hypothetical protein [Salmonella enterica]MBC9794326.1 hypothetical protein [Salmonella enterica subsp. enterica serovar Enteritidis]
MIQALLQRYEKKIERRKLEKRTAFGAFAGRMLIKYAPSSTADISAPLPE